MAISTNGTIYARLAGGLYNTVLSNATYLELVAQDPSTVANKLYAADFGKMTDLQVGTTIVANLGLSALTGLDAWVAAQLTAAGAANKGAKIVSMLNDFSAMTADTTYGTYATAYNTKVDAALAASQTTGKAEAKFSAAAPTVTSFTLTTSVDAIVGSAGDDTITAPNTVATTGADQTTINTGDTVDGGLGNDTLTMTFGGLFNTTNSVSIKGVENIVYVGVDNLASGASAVATATTAAATKATALTVAANQVAAATANATLAATAATAAATASTTAAAKQTGLTTLNTNIGTAANLAAVKVLTDAAVTATFLTATEKAVIDAAAATSNAAAQTALAPYTTAATTAATAALAAKNLADAQKTAVDAIVTANGVTNPVTAAAAADATAKADLAAAKLALGTVTIAANAEATSITIDGLKTTVSGLTDVQTVTMAGEFANTASTAATATKVNVKLSSAKGTLTLVGGTATTTAEITGSLVLGKASTTGGAANGTITLVDQVAGTPTSDSIKTLNLGLTSNSTVTLSELTALTTINGSTSTGGLTLTPLATTLNVTTGSGADDVNFIAATDITSTSKLTSSLSTGAGNDKMTVNVTGTGTSSVNAGAGDDTVTLTSGLGSAVVDGGDGKDTVVLPATVTSFGTGTYNNMKANVLNVEVLSLPGAATIDAAKASQFTEFTLTGGAGSVITKVADTQTVNITASASASSAGYVAKGGLDANGDTATATAYAGTLNATAKGGTLTANASALTLAVSNVSSVDKGVTLVTAASAVTLTGDVKTAAITVGSSVNNSKLPSAEFISSVTMTPTGAQDGGGAFTALGNLTSVTLSGTGSATVDNSTAVIAGTTRASKLATIDASGLAGKVTITGSTLGNATAGLTWTAGILAETVKLGSALDKLTVATANSTYAKMDSITGFTLLADATGVTTASTAAKSDDIAVGGITTFAKAATGYSATSLDAALATLGARAADNVVFQVAGNTYIFVDSSADTTSTISDADTLIELVGLVDLDNLVLALNGLN